jgi:hypothetical protein
VVASDRAASLAETDRRLIGLALKAVSSGPYIPDWEKQLVLAADAELLAQVADEWPEALATATWETDPQLLQYVLVNNVLNNLIGYPHGQWDRLASEINADRSALIELLGRWRGIAPQGYVDAIE